MKFSAILFLTLISVLTYSQTKTVWGQVIDENLKELEGVSIVTIDRNYYTATDNNGNFSIQLPIEYDTLKFIYIGLVPETVLLNNCHLNVIMLNERLIELNTQKMWEDYNKSINRKKEKLKKKAYDNKIFKNSFCYESPNVLGGVLFDKYQKPIVGCNIIVKGQNKGTVSDMNGEFMILEINKNDTLMFSCLETHPYIIEYPVNNLFSGVEHRFGIKTGEKTGGFRYYFKKNGIIWLRMVTD